MVLMITVGVLVSLGILAACWTSILNFLNGWLRDRLESMFGVEQCEGYVQFLLWLNDKVCLPRRQVLKLYAWLKEKVLSIKEHYRKTDAGYAKTTETYIAKPGVEGKCVRTVTEEEIPWEELPDSVRAEMIRHKVETAEMDVMDVIDEKVKEKIAVMA